MKHDGTQKQGTAFRLVLLCAMWSSFVAPQHSPHQSLINLPHYPVTYNGSLQDHINVGSQLLISNKHRLLFCYIQKNGCTETVKMMLQLAGQNFQTWRDVYATAQHTKLSDADPWANSYSAKFITDMVRNASWLKVVIVRNPVRAAEVVILPLFALFLSMVYYGVQTFFYVVSSGYVV